MSTGIWNFTKRSNMCGISGIIDKRARRVDTDIMERINTLISHRGPDDEGFFYHKNLAFGHRRLSILDLSAEGHQPMHYLDERYTITYNGEIYNYLEIRETLQKEGYAFRSHTDTEVILASYARWGEACVERFNGMWAFAIHDREEETIFCSRDRFGIKPFYYTEADGKFLFGSEIKQLLEFYPERYVNKTILADYLLYGLEEHSSETFFENIYKLEQSHNLIYDLKSNRYTIKKYFDLETDPATDTLDEQQSIALIQKRLKEAVSLRLRSDVKVGTCLSGGLDSSSIAALASQEYAQKSQEKFVAIHARSIEEQHDESAFARDVARHCDLELLEIAPRLDDITQNIEEVIYTQEEPFGGLSIFMQYFVMQKAKESGCTVMLDGQGGDETLFGYEHYYAVYFASLLKKGHFSQFIQELRQLETFKLSKRQVFKSTISTLLGNKMRHLKSLLGKEALKIKTDYDINRLESLFKFETFKPFQKRELLSRNLPHLLRYEDKNAMRHSVEARLPFIDYKFVTGAISIDDRLKFKDGYLKYMLRKAVEGLLPKSVVWRRNKFGFEAPADLWIDAHKEEMREKIQGSRVLQHMVEPDEKRFNNKKILWRLYNVAIWEKVYEVKFEK